jgi:hypothetical protein
MEWPTEGAPLFPTRLRSRSLRRRGPLFLDNGRRRSYVMRAPATGVYPVIDLNSDTRGMALPSDAVWHIGLAA